MSVMLLAQLVGFPMVLAFAAFLGFRSAHVDGARGSSARLNVSLYALTGLVSVWVLFPIGVGDFDACVARFATAVVVIIMVTAAVMAGVFMRSALERRLRCVS